MNRLAETKPFDTLTDCRCVNATCYKLGNDGMYIKDKFLGNRSLDVIRI